MTDFYTNLNHVSVVLISLSIILFSGFLVTRITKRLKLPNVSGFIIAGILIGPYVFKLVPSIMINGMDFVSDIALAFIAFGVGKFFKFSTLKRCGGKVIVITLMESLLAGVIVTLVLHFVFHTSWNFSLIAGAIGTATAPASTMMTIKQYKAKGEFVELLLQIVALDDVVALLAFSVTSAIAKSSADGMFHASDIYLPILYNLGGIVMGLMCGFILTKLVSNRSRDNRLIIVIAMLLAICGVCSLIDISPLLTCMAFGAVFINLSEDKKLFRQLDRFTPPVLSCFFILSGMRLNVAALKTAGIIGVTYFFIRIIGKYAGAYLGCALYHLDPKIRNNLGFALIPQAGVSIGLAILGQRLLPPDMGSLLTTIILTSSVFYELIGPVSAKAALVFGGAIKREALESYKKEEAQQKQAEKVLIQQEKQALDAAKKQKQAKQEEERKQKKLHQEAEKKQKQAKAEESKKQAKAQAEKKRKEASDKKSSAVKEEEAKKFKKASDNVKNSKKAVPVKKEDITVSKQKSEPVNSQA
ncbi:cation:proton antiporter [Anaerolentibacter hominis]|uniref:cation:proton antiporter domain-containing protein n=1 Tax=Anaerolentibacter hominis TaxID=3079009 RepID=UPI0031B7EDB6